MNTDSINALRRANPRTSPGFAASVDAAAEAVRARVALDEPLATAPRRRPRLRRPYVTLAAGSLAAAAVAATLLSVGLPGSDDGVESAQAAIERAVTATAESAEGSGTAVVRMTHGGEPWAGKTITWNGSDIAISRENAEGPRRAGSGLLVVDGVMYGIEPRVGWVNFGDPSNIDPDSGTTPAETLAAVKQDVGGATLRRITKGMTALSTRTLADGSTVHTGTVASGLVAREEGLKDGQKLRVLPFGYVANGAAAHPSAPLAASLTVGEDGVVREIAVAWGAWTYSVTYGGLGTTAAPEAPKGAVTIETLRAIR